MTLSTKDYDLALQTVAGIHDHRTLAEFRQGIFRVLQKAIAADYIVFSAFRMGKELSAIKLLTIEESESRATPTIVAAVERSIWRHPLSQHVFRTGDLSAMRLSDFSDPDELKADPDFQSMPLIDVNYALAAAISASPVKVAGISFCNSSRDFTHRDQTMLNLLRPHFARARSNAEQLTELIHSGATRLFDEHRSLMAQLTRRETEVAQWMARGKTNGEIAILLEASPRTIEKHAHKVLEKLRVENRTSAAVLINDVQALQNLRRPNRSA